MSQPIDTKNMNKCVQDVVAHAYQTSNEVRFDHYESHFQELLMNLSQAKGSLPQPYQEGVVEPFLFYLTQMGRKQFESLFTTPENQLNYQQSFLKKIIPDIALAILLNHQGYEEKASDAFQELVSDLYDGFLSAEDRRSLETGRAIAPPDRGVLPPLVKWGKPENGPYTWTIRATSILGLKAPIVSLPPGYARGGLLAWTSLGHETGGHDILHADSGLLEELKNKVYQVVFAETKSVGLAGYWSRCTDETASDVLGLLNMGPAAGIGLVGFFRGLNATQSVPGGKLRNVGSFDGPHPIDVLRGFVAAEIVKGLNFEKATEWSKLIDDETRKDLDPTLYVVTKSSQYYSLPGNIAEKSARIAAKTIASTPLQSLEGHKLKDIQDWTNNDENISRQIEAALKEGRQLPDTYHSQNFYATHVVAAATMAVLKDGADISALFKSMKSYLAQMHHHNTTWERTFEPLFLRGPTQPELGKVDLGNLQHMGNLV